MRKVDPEDAVWTGDGGRRRALIRFDQHTEKFTYAPEITDQPQLGITREGATWYTPRSSLRAAVGVLRPDVEKIRTPAADY